jgi:3-hydroxyisobutyrate dehydrogenase-like beta-hydroxyacid dehydrogenase
MFGFPVLQMYANKVKDRDFDDGGFRMTGGLKDISLMLNAAKSLGTSFDIGEIIKNKMEEALQKGMQDKDWSAIYEISRARANLK